MKHDPVELAAIAIPVLIEAVCVAIAIGCMMAMVAIMSAPVPL